MDTRLSRVNGKHISIQVKFVKNDNYLLIKIGDDYQAVIVDRNKGVRGIEGTIYEDFGMVVNGNAALTSHYDDPSDAHLEAIGHIVASGIGDRVSSKHDLDVIFGNKIPTAQPNEPKNDNYRANPEPTLVVRNSHK